MPTSLEVGLELKICYVTHIGFIIHALFLPSTPPPILAFLCNGTIHARDPPEPKSTRRPLTRTFICCD